MRSSAAATSFRRQWAWTAVAALVGAVALHAQSTQAQVYIFPGDDIQARIDAMPPGTTFRLQPGIHRLGTPLTPKTGNTFMGEPGAVLSGARLLDTFSRSGELWVASGQTQQGVVHGVCRPDHPRCSAPEDLYIDNVLQRHVPTSTGLGPGEWHFDYANDRIYIHDDPTGRTVETSVRSRAFTGAAARVTISGLIIEKFANPAQAGAIHGAGGSAWTITGNEIRFNHGAGVTTNHGMTLRQNHIHHNGQIGVVGSGDDMLLEGNQIAYNNTAGFNPGWEAGGAKFVRTRNLVVRRNWSHHNSGPGLWTDFDNIYTTYDGNFVEDNTGIGIFHEISYDAIIRDNTVRRNGLGYSAWLWGAGILVANSANVEIYRNTVADNGNGIGAIQQQRGSGAYGPWQTVNLHVHDNVVTMPSGKTGLAQDISDNSFFFAANNRFVNNTYRLGLNTFAFLWMNQQISDAHWRFYGHDTTGSFVR